LHSYRSLFDDNQEFSVYTGVALLLLDNDADNRCYKKEWVMDNRKLMDGDRKRLTLVVVFLSVLVVMLFGLGPLI
jgi:hypothetical protein